jgi:hypothetical protein
MEAERSQADAARTLIVAHFFPLKTVYRDAMGAGRNGKVARAIATVAMLIALGAIVSVAEAEVSSSGNLIVRFNGGITPVTLPRRELAPVTVSIDATVRIISGEEPPSVRQITLAVNRNGRLDSRGLPTCRIGQIETATGAQALRACGDALVGRGSYRARYNFAEQEASPLHGRILAFNSKSHGEATILAQVHSSRPTSNTNVIVLHIRHTSGKYGTVLTGTVPAGLSRWGYLKEFSLRLHRVYSYRHSLHSYLSAPCPAPRDLRRVSFPFVFASLSFADGRVLSSTLTRTCRVRK